MATAGTAAGGVLIANRIERFIIWHNTGEWVFLVFTICPALGAFVGAALIDWWWPRSLFDGPSGTWKTRSLRGIVAAAVAVALYTVCFAAADTGARGDAVLCAAGFLGAAAVLGAGKPFRDGACRTCGYDLRGSMSQDRCPECGTDIHASVA